MSTVTETLRSWAVQEVVTDRRARTGVGIVAFALAMVFGAQVAVPLPFTPVPMTLQPLFVLLAGAVLGPRPGAFAMALYLAVGAAGAPVFAGGGAGLPWLMGPTGGYLVAMPAAAWIAGTVVSAHAGTLRTLVGLVAGLVALYLGGLSQLFLLTGRGPGDLLALAVLPFLVGDAVKIVLALLLTRVLRNTSLGRG